MGDRLICFAGGALHKIGRWPRSPLFRGGVSAAATLFGVSLPQNKNPTAGLLPAVGF
jgi:hypothetical protein